MDFDPFVFRALERIIAVAIGGLAIYFGYRLFLAAPEVHGEGQAELSLAKDTRLLITRVGPGTFFALFGTAVVVASYYFPVTTSGAGGYSGLGEQGVAAAGPLVVPAPPPPEADALRRTIALINASQDLEGSGASAAERAAIAARAREAKLALMNAGWQRDWGDPVEFPIWLDQVPRPSRPEFERALATFEARD